MREFRRRIAQLASEAEVEVVKEEPIRARKDKGKGKEVVEEVGKGVAEEESMRGVLADCVVFFSTKSNVSLMFVFTRIYRKLIEETLHLVSVRSTTSRRYSQRSRWYCSSTIQRFRHSLHPLGSSERESCRILQRPQTCENERLFHCSSEMG